MSTHKEIDGYDLVKGHYATVGTPIEIDPKILERKSCLERWIRDLETALKQPIGDNGYSLHLAANDDRARSLSEYRTELTDLIRLYKIPK
jgi:hypothetical protein